MRVGGVISPSAFLRHDRATRGHIRGGSPRCPAGGIRAARWGQPGGYSLLFALTLPIVMGVAALVFDVGYLYLVRDRERHIAEAAALAAVKELDGTSDGLSSARAIATQIVGLNDPGGAFAFASSTEFTTGIWGPNSQTGVMEFKASTDALAVNAVKIVISQSASKGNAAPRFFSALASSGGIDVSNTAVAMVEFGDSGSSSDCNLASRGALTMSGNLTLTGRGCSNGNISMSGNVTVNGDLSCGPPPGKLTLTGNSTVTGSKACLDEAVSLPSVNVAPFRTANNNLLIVCGGCINSSKDLTLAGNNTLTLAAGTYYFRNVNVSGNAKIVVGAGVKIYVEGTMNVAGNGFFNTLQNPDNLKIFSAGSSVSLAGNTAFYGHLYAPDAAVSLSGNADFKGSFVGNTTSISGNFKLTGEDGISPAGSADSGKSVLVQ
jgi:Flp pilus assembly protein TadG